jgi:hypothetical protein
MHLSSVSLPIRKSSRCAESEVMLSRTPPPEREQQVLRARSLRAVEIIERSGAQVDRQKIESEIRRYLRYPGQPSSIVHHWRGLLPPTLTLKQKKVAERLGKPLRRLKSLLADQNLPPELDWRNEVQRWITAAHEVATTKLPRKAVAKRKFDAHSKLHAAEVAVRLFKHHGLVDLKCSHSPNNPLNKLAAAVYGQTLRTTDAGFYQHCRAAISSEAKTTRT